MLVTNTGGADHASRIIEIIRDADEIRIAIAFLKQGAAQRLAPILERRLEEGAVVELFVGTDFFLTEPKALELLLPLNECYLQCGIFVANQAGSTFHPKLYFARSGDEVRALVGSANMTMGCLETNEELSLLVDCTRGDALANDFDRTFTRYRDWNRFQDLDALVLQQYAGRFDVNEQERRKFERARDTAMPGLFDLRVIDDWYALYRSNSAAMSELALRRERRAEALQVQNRIAALSRGEINRQAVLRFQTGLRDLMTSNGGRHLWPSDAIFRQGSNALDHPEPMIRLFAAARTAARRPPVEGYEVLRTMSKGIPGVGINMATEILCTFAPDRYAVYNGNTVAALRTLGIDTPKYPNFQAISPGRYGKLCATIRALGGRIGSEDFSEADDFLNWIYQTVKLG